MLSVFYQNFVNLCPELCKSMAKHKIRKLPMEKPISQQTVEEETSVKNAKKSKGKTAKNKRIHDDEIGGQADDDIKKPKYRAKCLNLGNGKRSKSASKTRDKENKKAAKFQDEEEPKRQKERKADKDGERQCPNWTRTKDKEGSVKKERKSRNREITIIGGRPDNKNDEKIVRHSPEKGERIEADDMDSKMADAYNKISPNEDKMADDSEPKESNTSDRNLEEKEPTIEKETSKLDHRKERRQKSRNFCCKHGALNKKEFIGVKFLKESDWGGIIDKYHAQKKKEKAKNPDMKRLEQELGLIPAETHLYVCQSDGTVMKKIHNQRVANAILKENKESNDKDFVTSESLSLQLPAGKRKRRGKGKKTKKTAQAPKIEKKEDSADSKDGLKSKPDGILTNFSPRDELQMDMSIRNEMFCRIFENVLRECLDLAFVLCERFEFYNGRMVFQLFDSLFPSAFIYRTSLWPFYSDRDSEPICICKRYDLRCNHAFKENSDHCLELPTTPCSCCRYTMLTGQVPRVYRFTYMDSVEGMTAGINLSIMVMVTLKDPEYEYGRLIQFSHSLRLVLLHSKVPPPNGYLFDPNPNYLSIDPLTNKQGFMPFEKIMDRTLVPSEFIHQRNNLGRNYELKKPENDQFYSKVKLYRPVPPYYQAEIKVQRILSLLDDLDQGVTLIQKADLMRRLFHELPLDDLDKICVQVAGILEEKYFTLRKEFPLTKEEYLVFKEELQRRNPDKLIGYPSDRTYLKSVEKFIKEQNDLRERNIEAYEDDLNLDDPYEDYQEHRACLKKMYIRNIHWKRCKRDSRNKFKSVGVQTDDVIFRRKSRDGRKDVNIKYQAEKENKSNEERDNKLQQTNDKSCKVKGDKMDPYSAAIAEFYEGGDSESDKVDDSDSDVLFEEERSDYFKSLGEDGKKTEEENIPSEKMEGRSVSTETELIDMEDVEESESDDEETLSVIDEEGEEDLECDDLLEIQESNEEEVKNGTYGKIKESSGRENEEIHLIRINQDNDSQNKTNIECADGKNNNFHENNKTNGDRQDLNKNEEIIKAKRSEKLQ